MHAQVSWFGIYLKLGIKLLDKMLAQYTWVCTDLGFGGNILETVTIKQ